jgi:FKBP-type peptidyl-prolyl cis-trans isomerase (trigger factor)
MSKGKKKVFQNNSFQNMVEDKAQKQAQELLAKNVVQPLVQQYMMQFRMEFTRQVMNDLAQIQLRIRNLEQRAGITDEQLAEDLMDLEDKATGFTKVDRGAEKGDQVRFTYTVKVDGNTTRLNDQRGLISELGKSEGKDIQVIHEKLLGATAGQTVEFTEEFDGETPEAPKKKVEYTVTVNRVSEKVQNESQA